MQVGSWGDTSVFLYRVMYQVMYHLASLEAP